LGQIPGPALIAKSAGLAVAITVVIAAIASVVELECLCAVFR